MSPLSDFLSIGGAIGDVQSGYNAGMDRLETRRLNNWRLFKDYAEFQLNNGLEIDPSAVSDFADGLTNGENFLQRTMPAETVRLALGQRSKEIRQAKMVQEQQQQVLLAKNEDDFFTSHTASQALNHDDMNAMRSAVLESLANQPEVQKRYNTWAKSKDLGRIQADAHIARANSLATFLTDNMTPDQIRQRFPNERLGVQKALQTVAVAKDEDQRQRAISSAMQHLATNPALALQLDELREPEQMKRYFSALTGRQFNDRDLADLRMGGSVVAANQRDVSANALIDEIAKDADLVRQVVNPDIGWNEAILSLVKAKFDAKHIPFTPQMQQAIAARGVQMQLDEANKTHNLRAAAASDGFLPIWKAEEAKSTNLLMAAVDTVNESEASERKKGSVSHAAAALISATYYVPDLPTAETVARAIRAARKSGDTSDTVTVVDLALKTLGKAGISLPTLAVAQSKMREAHVRHVAGTKPQIFGNFLKIETDDLLSQEQKYLDGLKALTVRAEDGTYVGTVSRFNALRTDALRRLDAADAYLVRMQADKASFPGWNNDQYAQLRQGVAATRARIVAMAPPSDMPMTDQAKYRTPGPATGVTPETPSPARPIRLTPEAIEEARALQQRLTPLDNQVLALGMVPRDINGLKKLMAMSEGEKQALLVQAARPEFLAGMARWKRLGFTDPNIQRDARANVIAALARKYQLSPDMLAEAFIAD